MPFRSILLSWYSLALSLALGSSPVAAQLLAPTHGQAYDFLTVTAIEAPTRPMAKLLFAPAVNGCTELQLEPVGAFSTATLLAQVRHNNELLVQSLGELSAAGWELIQVAPAPLTTAKEVTATRYLLRRAKN